MSEKLIIISSEDRDASESNTNSDFIVNLKERYNTQNIARVLVKSIQVPNVFYNVRSGSGAPGSGTQNNTLLIQENGQPDATATIPEGQYTTTTLLTALDTAINAQLVGGTVATTQNALTQKLTFTFTSTTAKIYSNADGSTAADLIGIGTSSAIAASVVADSLPNLSGVNKVFVHSQDVALSHAIDGDSGLISAMDSLSFHNVAFGAMGYMQNPDAELALIDYSSKSINLSRIRIVLRDNLGAKLDIGTSKMIVVLKVFYAMETD